MCRVSARALASPDHPDLSLETTAVTVLLTLPTGSVWLRNATAVPARPQEETDGRTLASRGRGTRDDVRSVGSDPVTGIVIGYNASMLMSVGILLILLKTGRPRRTLCPGCWARRLGGENLADAGPCRGNVELDVTGALHRPPSWGHVGRVRV